jgi:hypothetical protein
MTMHRSTAIACGILLLASMVAGAATPWPQEPDSMFGIALGKRFPAAGEIGDCPLFAPFRRENLPDDLCVDTRAGVTADSIVLRYVPLGNVLADARVALHDGLVGAIVASFDRRQYGAVKTTLIDRFGAPQSHDGGEGGETLSWSGSRIAMTLREAADRKDRSAFELRDLSLAPRK